MKKTLLLAVILTCSTLVYAQNELLIQNSDKGIYLNHTVVAKENYYSIGRLFNTSAKEIAAFNGLDMNVSLMIGQQLRIPLSTTNFTQTKNNGRAVYYVVGNGEGLYRVSVKNRNVLMANIRKWNQLDRDQVSAGQKLIIGYLVSPEANNIQEPVPNDKATVHVEEPKKEVVRTDETKKEIQIQKEEPVTDKIVDKSKKQVEQKIEPAIKNKSNTPTTTAVNDGQGGYFKTQFDLQIKGQPLKIDQTASAGIFKTASGWQDAKYYALMDGVEPGTIIRIVNPTNNKAVYTKVLGEMSGIRQNQGYDVRLSNAAAAALSVSETDKFIVRVIY